MNFYGNYKSPLGYQTGENQVDTYGVDHSGFSTRDELEYQFARQNKENQLIQNYNNQGITKNYPQQGTNFWGLSPENNYGFGTSKIHDNIENRNNNPFENTVNTFGQSQTEQSYGLGSENQAQVKPVYETPNPRRYSTEEILWDGVKGFGQGFVSGLETLANGATLGGYNLLEINASNENQSYLPQKNNFNKDNPVPRYWETAADGEKVWNYVQQQEGDVIPKGQKPLGYGLSAILGGIDAVNNYQDLKNARYTDKYKHALINCKAAQSGLGGYDLVNVFSNFKEDRDISSGRNTLDSSQADQYANKIGRLLGTKYPNGDCDVIVQNYINKHY